MPPNSRDSYLNWDVKSKQRKIKNWISCGKEKRNKGNEEVKVHGMGIGEYKKATDGKEKEYN